MARVQNPQTATSPPCVCNGGLKEWSTTEELAAWLGVDVEHLYYLAGHGKGPARHRIGKGFKYRARDVETWLAHAGGLGQRDHRSPSARSARS